jgi:pimeloyl-ACP methyl ester carboxylesterase
MAQAPAYTEESTSHFVDVAGVKIHYHEVGKGEPLLAIHGGGPGASGWSNFSPNIPTLSQHFRLLLIDLPQFGKSDPVVIPEASPVYYARTVEGFLRALDIERAHLLGNSLGGTTAMKVAIDYPERVDKLMVMGAPTGRPSNFMPMPTEGIRRLQVGFANPTKETLHDMIKIFVYDASFVTDELLEQRLKAAKNDAILDARRKSSTAQYDVVAELPRIKAKTLLLWGRDDRVVPLDYALTLMYGIPDAHLHVFPRCGHWVQYEGRDAFNRIVIDWIKNQ